MRTTLWLWLITITLVVTGLTPGGQDQDGDRPGYDDGPQLPDSPWRVHDKARPYPRIVAPGAVPGAPPADAIVLFDGTGLDAWTAGAEGARWKVADGFMEVNGTGGIATRESFGDCQLHLEWAAPAEVTSSSQGRGNSGVFFMGRFEVQVLDSFQNPTYADGQAAALYGQAPPLVNACRGPGEWQTYDIVFEAPRFAAGQLVSPAYATVIHNGVVVHHRRPFIGPTRHRSLPKYEPQAETGPIALQDHGNPVRYRNVWVRPLDR